MIKKPTKKVMKKPAKKPVKSAVKRTQKRTPKKVVETMQLTSLSEILETWDKEQGPLPSLHEIAGELEDVCNTLNDIQHVMDSALDDCVNMNNDARAMSLLHLAYGMVKESVDTLDAIFSNLHRINRASLK